MYRHADKLYLGDNRAVDESAIWADSMDLLADTRDDGEVLKRNPVKIRLQHSRYGTSAKLLRMNVKQNLCMTAEEITLKATTLNI